MGVRSILLPEHSSSLARQTKALLKTTPAVATVFMAHETVSFWKRSNFDSVFKTMRFHYLFHGRHVNGVTAFNKMQLQVKRRVRENGTQRKSR